MTRHNKLLFSSALVTLACIGVPAFAQSYAPNTDYGSFKPVAVGQIKSYADGRIEGKSLVIAPPSSTPVPSAVIVPAPQAPVQVAQPVAEVPAEPKAEVVKTAKVETPPPAPVVDKTNPVAEVSSAPPQSPSSNETASAAPVMAARKPEEEPVANTAPVLDDQFPEEREARTRLARAYSMGEAPDAAASAAARLAALPPVPEDIIQNVPLSDVPIREVAVEGLQRIEPLTVQSYLDVAVGEVLTSEKRNQSLKNLYESGLFSDVAIDQKKDILNVLVKENPQINQLAFEGNKRIKEKELSAEIQLRPRAIYTREKALQDTDRILNLYRRSGRYAARVEPKVIEKDQNRVDLAFEIAEGPVTEIRGIRFVGNKDFSDKELRSAIASRITRWYRFLSSDDQYDPDRFEYDQELLRQFYLKHGYADFKVVSALAELTPDKEDFYLTFTMDEGQRYKIGKVNVVNNLKKFDSKSFDKDLSIKAGDWYNADSLTKVVDKMTTTLGNQQYAFANVKSDVKRNPENHTVDITFTVNESPKVYVERIDVNGNVRTLDKVIRREFELAEGDPFNKEKLAKSEKQIKDLGFFKNTDIKVKEGSSPDKIAIEANVEEQSTGDIQIGGGYSTVDGPLANFQIQERNFLGKGQNLRLATLVAGRRSQFDVGFTEPYFLDRKLEAGVDLFYITRNLQRESSYDLQRKGGALRLGYDLSEKWRQSWKIGVEDNDIQNVKDNASRFVRDQEGQRTTLSVSHRISYDTRDSKTLPHEGLYSWLDTEVAGIADAQFIKNRLGAQYYIPLGEQWTFSQLGEVGNVFGYGGKNVEINERFFIGGNTMHGFSYGGLGPRDISTDDALGGNNFYRGSSEVTFPISIDKDLPLKGHTFVDYGSVWGIDEPSSPDLADSSSLRVAAGFGVSWDSPFGPLRVDFSAPIVKEDYDEKEVFQFAFGTAF